MRFFKSIKFRLTISYLIFIMVLLLGFGITAYSLMSLNLYQDQDDSLRTRLAELQTSLKVENGRISFAEKLSELVLIYDASGSLLQRVGPAVEFASINGMVKTALFGQTSFLTAISGDGQEVRFYAAPFTTGSNTRIAILVGRLTAGIKDVLDAFRSVLGISSLAAVAFASMGGFFLADRALKPVDRITGTAQEIGESDLSQRINVKGEDELGRLAATLNRMIGRLEAAFNRQRQFTADASHELRTPLAIIQAESTLALDKERTAGEYRKSLELVSQEVVYMSALIGKLLFLVRSEAGKEPFDFKEVNLKDLTDELVPHVEVLAQEKGIQFKAGQFEDITVKGDRIKLRELFLNLLQNAVKYTDNGGEISISVAGSKQTAIITVTDTGIGIPAEHLPLIFERFYRVDKARSRAEGGAGLGLAIAKCIAVAHGGKIEVESQVGKGSTFRVILPLSTPQPA